MIIQYSVRAANSYEGDIEDGHLVTFEDVFEQGFCVEGENMTIADALVKAEEHLKNYVGLKIIAIEFLEAISDDAKTQN
ncbi:hypothetical protein ACFLZ5_00590 [Thermodesulfobacteriota bacterium]